MTIKSISFQTNSVGTANAKMSLLDWLRPRRVLRALAGRFREKESAATLVRLTRSKHVADLRFIARMTVWGALLFVIVVALLGAVGACAIPVIGLLGTAATILAWCYRSGSARLGIVDLIACEMTTLCRVCSVVELTQNCITAFNTSGSDTADQLRERFSHFDSEEAYTPVFDANVKELQVLDVRVITNITAFYTYWKAMRDTFRRLAKTDAKGWQSCMRNVVYMQFLAFESARNAIVDLIEFEPSCAENKVTVLLSELPAFRFLLDQFKDGSDVRHKRLALRRDEYPGIVEDVTNVIYENAAKYPKKEERSNLSKFERDRAAGWDQAIEMLGPLEAYLHDRSQDDTPRLAA
jgi:hypothetical protein